jgi:hypothetical protein
MIPPVERRVIDVPDQFTADPVGPTIPAFVSRRRDPERAALIDDWAAGRSGLVGHRSGRFVVVPEPSGRSAKGFGGRALIGLCALAFACGYVVAWCVA